nr:hypothetical protein [Tanacetum cinerariifolium]
MIALVISISLDLSDERAATIASLVGKLELDTHSLSEVDPLESSLPPIFVATIVSPFLCSSDLESDIEMSERHVSPKPYDVMLARWRSRVASRSSSPTTSTPEIPTAPIPPAPFDVDIPIGRLYRTYLGGPSRALATRKSVRPLPSHRLALRHTPPVATIVDSSAPLRFVYPPLTRTLRYSEAYRHWRCALLYTMYPSMTSESSARDSFSESSARPSRKRCSSPAAIVTSSIHASRSLVPSCAGLFPPRKRFKDSILPEDSVEEDIDIDVLANIKADATTVEVAANMDVQVGVDASIGMEVNIRVDVEDEVEGERLEQVEEVVQDIYGHVTEIPLYRVVSLERSNARLQGTLMMKSTRSDRFRQRMGFMESELRQIQKFRYYDRMRFRRWDIFVALAAYEANRAAKLVVKSQSQNGDNDDNVNVRGNGNGNSKGNGDGNGGGNSNGNGEGNGNGNPKINDRGATPVARECTYHDFMKCQPLNFKGTEGVVGLTSWFEKIETVYYIINCPERYQVKYARCTLLNSALT